jgi:hypothetical protein
MARPIAGAELAVAIIEAISAIDISPKLVDSAITSITKLDAMLMLKPIVITVITRQPRGSGSWYLRVLVVFERGSKPTVVTVAITVKEEVVE